MNRKAQALGIAGAILVTFIIVIVGLALYNGGIQSNIGATTLTRTYNTTAGDAAITMPEGTAITLTGQAVSNFLAINATGGEVVQNANFTLANYQVVDGELTATLNNASASIYGGQSLNVSYTYEPLGYATSSGARAMITLIAVFVTLAIAITALVPTFRSGVMNAFGK